MNNPIPEQNQPSKSKGFVLMLVIILGVIAAMAVGLLVIGFIAASAVFPIPNGRDTTVVSIVRRNIREVVLPVSEVGKAEGIPEPHLNIPDNIFQWIVGNEVTVNLVYEDVEKWVAGGCVGSPVLRRGKNDVKDISIKLEFILHGQNIKTMMIDALTGPDREYIAVNDIEKAAGLERFIVTKLRRGGTGQDTYYIGNRYYWTSDMTIKDGTYISSFLEDGHRPYLEMDTTIDNIYIEIVFPENMMEKWREIRSNTLSLVRRWEGVEINGCGDK